MDDNQIPDPDLIRRFRRLGTHLSAQAPPVTTAEVLSTATARSDRWRHAPLGSDPLLTPGEQHVPLLPVDEGIGCAPTPGRHRGVLIGAVAAVSMLVVGLGVVDRGGNEREAAGSSGTTAASVETVAQTPLTTPPTPTGAEVNQASSRETAENVAWPARVLAGADWRVLAASESSVDEGYMTLQRDDHVVLLGWYRGDVSREEEWYAEKGFTEVAKGTLLGNEVPIYSGLMSFRAGDIAALVERGVVTDELIVAEYESGSYDDADDLIGSTALQEALAEAVADGLIDGSSSSLETSLVTNGVKLGVQVGSILGGTRMTVEEFVDLLATIQQVEPADWEAAMPDSVVTPSERPGVVDELLTGVPTPEAWDPAGVPAEPVVQARAQVASDVLEITACAWLNLFFTAEPGSAEARTALDAIGTIPQWPAAQELRASWDEETPGTMPIPNDGFLGLSVNAVAGTITHAGTGETLDGYSAATMCGPSQG